MRCPACGDDSPTESKFCGECGAPLGSACPVCGAANPQKFKFCSECGTSLTDLTTVPPGERRGADQAPHRPQPASLAYGQAERRQVTVLFCDLVGFTAMSSQLDPEELRELVHAYRAMCASVVERFDGYVAQYLGDGILAYFGYPKAHEDDAERAVRAGLGIVDGVQRVGPVLASGRPIPVAARVGVATGLVVAPVDQKSGDSVVIGETPNVAARLQDLAPPNGVVVAPQTRHLLGDRFVCEDLGTRELKGMARPLEVWRVLGPNEALTRFEAAHPLGLTPLVDRDEEVDLLLRRWRRAKGGEGQVVLLSGEAGVGKSRIAQTLCDRIGSDSPTILRFQCSPHYSNSALYPVVRRLERVLGFDRKASPEERLAGIEALVTRAGLPVDTVAPLLAALLSVPTGERYARLEVTPQRQRDRTLATLQDLLVRLATQGPVLVVAEDVHWIDPTSQELLDLIVERVSGLPALVLLTFRPGYWPAWTGSPHVTFGVVNRLSREESAAMVRLVAGGKALPNAISEPIVAKTDGAPLFIEEVTKAVLESGVLQELPDRYVLTGALPPRVIPATLRDSLMARLDQAAAVREVAQIGSVIGRQFSYEVLAALSGAPEGELLAALDQLVRAELVFRHGIPPDATYVFKHALVQEAAYESLLLARRQALHGRVVEVLESKCPDLVAASPEALAYHCTAARLHEKAVGYWDAAGLRASERSANLEAIAHLTKGLEVLGDLPDSLERQEQELRLLVTLGPVLINAKGPRTREVAESYARALELCARLPESPLHFAAFWGSSRISENFHTKRDREYSLLAVAERLGDPGLRLQAHHRLWASLFHLGQHEACCEHVAKGLYLYGLGDYRAHGALYGGHDPKVCAIGEKGLALWLLGCPERSLEASREAMAWARTLAHSGSIAHAMDIRLMLHGYRRDVGTVRQGAEQMIAYAEEQGLPVHRAKGMVFLGWALAELGEAERGIEYMREGLEAQKAIGTREDFPVFFEMLVGAYARAGHGELALDVLAEILEETERTGLCYWTPELYRARGEVLMSVSAENEAEAEGWFRRAVGLAQEQRAKSLELRAAASLARIEQRRGRRDQAYAVLAPAYAWFREGFDTLDLVEAKAVLDELGPTPGPHDRGTAA